MQHMPCLTWTTSLVAKFQADNLVKMQVGSMGRGGLYDREARLTSKAGHSPIITAKKKRLSKYASQWYPYSKCAECGYHTSLNSSSTSA